MNKDLSNKIIDFFLKKFHIKLTEKNHHLLVQIFNFGIVGFTATIIDFVFLYIFKEYFDLSVILANTISFILSVIYNYWASLTFVFDVNKEKDKRKNFIIFIIFSVIGLIINDIIIWIITEFTNIHYLISKIIATIIVMIFNFITRKKFL